MDQKNGYDNTGYKAAEGKEAYTFLPAARDVSPAQFQMILQKMSFGSSRISAERATEKVGLHAVPARGIEKEEPIWMIDLL